MENDSSLLVDVAVAFAVALAGGWLATRLRLPAIAGYVLAGLVISPFTPGFVGDTERLRLLADIGVVLLLFAIGAQFTIADLLAGGLKVIGLAVLVTVAVIGGAQAVAPLLGWSWEEAAYVGAAASIASSVVPVMLLERRGELSSEHGRIAIGTSVIQDLLGVLLIIVLDATTGSEVASGLRIAGDAVLAAGKAMLFISAVIVVGLRVVPFVLNRVAEERSRDLFYLAVAGLVIGTALASDYVGLSLALGAFLAGIIVSESDLSHRVLGELLPVRDVFSVLFFVTAGMLVAPSSLVEDWPALVVVFGLIVAAKPIVFTALLTGTRTILPVAALAGAFMVPTGEFAFLLSSQGLDEEVISESLFSSVITAAVVSMVLAPLSISLVEGLLLRMRPAADHIEVPQAVPSRVGRHAIVCGYNEVGRTVASILSQRFEVIVVEEDPRLARQAREEHLEVVDGSPVSPAVIDRVDAPEARVVIIALEDPLATRLFAERIRARNRHVEIIARGVVRSEAAKLRTSGIAEAVIAEDEVAFEMARHSLHRFGLSSRETLAIIQQMRARARLPD